MKVKHLFNWLCVQVGLLVAACGVFSLFGILIIMLEVFRAEILAKEVLAVLASVFVVLLYSAFCFALSIWWMKDRVKWTVPKISAHIAVYSLFLGLLFQDGTCLQSIIGHLKVF